MHWRIIISPIYFLCRQGNGNLGAVRTLLHCKQRAAEEILRRGLVESVIDPAARTHHQVSTIPSSLSNLLGMEID